MLMSAFKNKFVVVLVVSFFCGPLIALNNEYQDGLNSFRGKDVGVMFGTLPSHSPNLMNRNAG